jgi:hypothetical protein
MFWVTQKNEKTKKYAISHSNKKKTKNTQFLLNVFEWNVTAAIELVFDQNCIFAFHCFSTGPSTALSSYVLSHFQLTKFCQISKSVSKTIANIPNNNKTIEFFYYCYFYTLEFYHLRDEIDKSQITINKLYIGSRYVWLLLLFG